MEKCSNCREDLQPGFDFCHHCGAAARQPAAAQPARSNLVKMVGDLEQMATRSVAASSTASQAVNDWLGRPTSIQRRIFYALLTGLAVVLASGSTPLSGPSKWLEGWLLLSLLVLPFISYWLTGFIPFSNVLNAILGDVLSLRRRLTVTFLWTTLISVFFVGLSLVKSAAAEEGGLQAAAESLAIYVGIFLIVFYFMGQTSGWRPIGSLEGSLFLDRMAQSADHVSNSIRDQMAERNINNLQTDEIEMARLRRYTAGESSGREGRQLTFITGRAQVVLLVQDFGHGLAIRWGGYYDASGRRLWIICGLILRGLNDLTLRWTGTNPTKYWQEYMSALKPLSRSSINLIAMTRGSFLTRFFVMPEGLSEYAWNELCALEASVKETVVNVARDAREEHEEADAIQAQMAIHAQIERHRRFEGSTAPQKPGNTGSP